MEIWINIDGGQRMDWQTHERTTSIYILISRGHSIWTFMWTPWQVSSFYRYVYILDRSSYWQYHDDIIIIYNVVLMSCHLWRMMHVAFESNWDMKLWHGHTIYISEVLIFFMFLYNKISAVASYCERYACDEGSCDVMPWFIGLMCAHKKLLSAHSIYRSVIVMHETVIIIWPTSLWDKFFFLSFRSIIN